MAADLRDLLTPASDPHALQSHHQQYPPANGHGYGHTSGGDSRGGGGGRGGADNSQLYLGVPQLTEQDIRSLLSHHGSIRTISCKPEFSFVEMETPEQAKAVIAEFDRKTVDLKDANGSVIRTIQEFKCEFSRPRRERGPRGPSSRYDDSGAGGHGGGGGAGGKATTCYVCNKEGHWARDCPQSTRSANVCYNCNQPGHRARDCPQPRSENRRGPPPSSHDRRDDRRDYRDRDRDYRDTHRDYPPRDTRYEEYPPRDTRYGGSSTGYPPAAAAAPTSAYPPPRDYDRGYRRSRSRSPPPRGYDDRYHRRSPSPVRGYPPAAPAAYAPPPSSRYDSRGAPPAPYAPPAVSAYAPPPAASSVPYYRDAAPPVAAAPYDPYAKYDRRDPYAPAPVAAPAAYAPPTASTYGSYSAPPPASSYPPRGASGSSSNGSRRY